MTVEEHLDQHIRVATFTAVVDHLDAATQGGDAVVGPSVGFE